VLSGQDEISSVRHAAIAGSTNASGWQNRS